MPQLRLPPAYPWPRGPVEKLSAPGKPLAVAELARVRVRLPELWRVWLHPPTRFSAQGGRLRPNHSCLRRRRHGKITECVPGGFSPLTDEGMGKEASQVFLTAGPPPLEKAGTAGKINRSPKSVDL